MAHVYGRASTRASSTGNPISVSWGTQRYETVMVVLLKVNGGTDRAGGALTYAGRTLVQANSTQKAATSPEASAELWYLENPPVGTYTLTIPNTGALTVFYTIATGKAGAGGRSLFSGANGANATATNPSPGSVTTRSAGAIYFAVVATGAQTWSPSSQAGTVISNDDDGVTGGGTQYYLQAAAGAFTLSWTFGTSDDYGAVVAAFEEVSPPAFNNYLSAHVGDGMGSAEVMR